MIILGNKMNKKEERSPVILLNEGQKIFGVIHRPENAIKTPAVLICHGLGGNKIGKGRLYVLLAEILAANGITTLRVDFRGSGDSEGDFSKMTIESEVSDALVALDYLKNDPQVDADRIAIFGRSFGGVVAVLASHEFSTIKSLALWAPVFGCDQWKEKWQKAHSAPLTSQQREGLMNIEGLQPGYAFLQQLFTLNLAEKLKSLDGIPLLHIHGEKDNIVDLTHANRFREARNHVLEKSHFKLLPDSDHDFLNSAERKIALADTAEWFVKTLCP